LIPTPNRVPTPTSVPKPIFVPTTYYNSPVVEITSLEIGVLETFFPITGRPPINLKSHIMCLGLIPNHFVLLLWNGDLPLPLSSIEWNNHKSEEVTSLEDEFLDQHDCF